MNHDYYSILSVSPSVSATELKLAYHRALLLFHPDKQVSNSGAQTHDSIDLDVLKEAYTTLSSPELRLKYDAACQNTPSGPRPAQVVSLEEFTEEDIGDGEGRWTFRCRCSGAYVITEQEMEGGQHLIGCSTCSEVVWVGYELAEGARE